MNILTIRDATGRLVSERPVPEGTIVFTWPHPVLGPEVSVTIAPPPGYQLNGHRIDCRCGTCRPDLYITSAWVPSYDPWGRP